MKWAHRLLGLALGAALLFLLVTILLPAFQGGEAWRTFLQPVTAHPSMVAIGAAGLLLGLVVFFLTGFAPVSGSRYLAYETQQGNISISLKALQDFLAHMKSEFPAIVSLQPHVEALDENLDVVLEIRVKSGSPIPEVSRQLQDRARYLIQERIGISEIRDIQVKVEEIVKEKEKERDPRAQEITPLPPPAGEVP